MQSRELHGEGSRYSRGNRGKSAVMGTEFTVVPLGWGTNLRYFRGDGDSGYTVVPAVLQIAGLFHWLGTFLKKDFRNCWDLQLMDCCFSMD